MSDNHRNNQTRPNIDGIDYFRKQRQGKTEEFMLEQIKLPRVSKRSLDQTWRKS